LELIGENYGVGELQQLDESIELELENDKFYGIKYLHPRFLLLNKKMYPMFYPFIKHGAPNILTMADIQLQNMQHLLVDLPKIEKYIYRGIGMTREKFGSCMLGIPHRKFTIRNYLKRDDILKPAFTIITPTFKRKKLLKRCIESIFSQTYQNFEHIIIDDADDKNVAKMVKETNDKRIRYYAMKKNAGVAKARNTGIQMALGKYICFLDDDDAYYPGYLGKVYDLFQQNDNKIGFIWTGIKKIDSSVDNEKILLNKKWPSGFDSNETGLAVASSIGSGYGVCVQKKCIEEIGLFDEKLEVSEDTDLMIRLAQTYEFKTVPEILVNIYKHSDKQLSDDKNSSKKWHSYKLIMKRHSEFLNKYAPVLHSHTKAYAGLCYGLNKKWTGRRSVLNLIVRHPWNAIFYKDFIAFELFGKHYHQWLREKKKR